MFDMRCYQWLHHTFFPLFLILFTPLIVIIFWYTNVFLGGSLWAFWKLVEGQGFFQTLWQICSPIMFGSPTAWKMILVFALLQLGLMKVVPGSVFYGPETSTGHTPLYKANGFFCYLITLACFYLGGFHWKLFSPTLIYDHFGELLGALNCFSLIFCLILYFKGRFMPSTADSGSSGNFIFDYYWGTELYPRLGGWDVKQFTNCRFGMMSWPLIILSFATKQSELYGLTNSMAVSLLLQFIYITKFFIWETGYLRSLDIMHDRAGYYICWGCLVWVPGIYTSPSLYLVNHPNQLNSIVAFSILFVGASAILINFWADRQRQIVRLKNGLCNIWGKPAQISKARYVTHDGKIKENILLVSGWWGIARHFHYIPEIIGALCWTLPALFDNFIPYFYVIFLTVLLVDRAFRDERRCSKKYGEDWKVYCHRVPYKIFPYVV